MIDNLRADMKERFVRQEEFKEHKLELKEKLDLLESAD